MLLSATDPRDQVVAVGEGEGRAVGKGGSRHEGHQGVGREHDPQQSQPTCPPDSRQDQPLVRRRHTLNLCAL